MLIHSLSMTSILCVMVKFYRNQFKCKYIRTKSLFLIFLVDFFNLNQCLKIFKRERLKAYILRTLGMRKTCLAKSLKITVSEDSLTVNMLNGPKQSLNLDDRTFIIFSITVSGSEICKI